MPNRNLEPGQYQIGELPFGFATQFHVEDFDIGGYEVNVQDYQRQLSDENQFGSDSFKGLPIQLMINYTENKIMEHMVSLTGDTRELDFVNQRRIGQFTREWRADEIRKEWGELKPLYVCRPDGHVVQVYGRPGNCKVSKPNRNGVRNIVAEFRRSDTLCYNDFEWFAQIRKDEELTIFRSEELGHGDAPSWVRFFLVGPMTNPEIQFGDQIIKLNYELEAGDIVEISSYPWQRRVVRLNDGLSLNAYLTEPYLEQIKFDTEKPIKITWDALDTNAQVEQESFSEYADTTDGLPTDLWFPAQYTSGTGRFRVDNGRLEWVDVGNEARYGMQIYRAPTISKYQLIGYTTHSPAEDVLGNGQPYARNRIIGRCNAARTEYLFWDITYKDCWFGYHAPDGTERILSEVFQFRKSINVLRRILNDIGATLFGHDGNPKAGWQYDAEFGTGAGLLTSNLMINKTKLFTASVPINDIALPDDSLYGGLGFRATSRNLGQSTPASLTEWHIRDNPIVPIDVSSVYVMWRDAWQNI